MVADVPRRRKFKKWEDSPVVNTRESRFEKSGKKGNRQNKAPIRQRFAQSAQRVAPGAGNRVLDKSIRVGALDPEQFFYSKKALEEIGVDKEAEEALAQMGVTRPSKIQSLAYRTVLSGDSCLLADQTGSGKTLAYLLPIMQRLREEEQHFGDAARAQPGKPRVIVLAPTAELAVQVHQVVKGLSAQIKLTSMCFTGQQYDPRQQARLLQKQGLDIVVATPGRLNSLLERGALDLSSTTSIVLDEVDVLYLEENFNLNQVGVNAPMNTQFVFVTATLPELVVEQVKEEFPDIKTILGPGLHRVSPNLDQVIVDCSGPWGEKHTEDSGFRHKREALTELLATVPAQRTLVFCNTIENCRKVENAVQRWNKKGQKALVLAHHNAIDPERRGKHLRSFMRPNSLLPMILICTDRASRGMDFDTADVEHVILFDFPRDPSEYMRRVGRTARAGRTGRVTSLVFGRQLGMARDIIRANREGERLQPIPKK
eukprot:CAMPEP_0113940268 /NCGR_PEP_ID=MMETSP1339-20121228/6432_1 /TAXON_ID=94617 /ORGANISM="Fibrocapsa japonica" /LENGTH=484 /DNA_ID=CAMNT_0000944039 /DNA_START=194 /DNA_END=1648 /DNA_ORIENTATION=- /assembly_acc=CAM_ASM_000762